MYRFVKLAIPAVLMLPAAAHEPVTASTQPNPFVSHRQHPSEAGAWLLPAADQRQTGQKE